MPYTLDHFPIPEKIIAGGGVLEPDTVKWMQRWQGLNLEDTARYSFPELSGSTSVNLKLETTDNPPKARGTFVTRNSSANPNTEIAYFNLLSLLGWGRLCRPAARYELGPVAAARFRTLLEAGPMSTAARQENCDAILAAIATGAPLRGCVKAKKPDSLKGLDAIADTGAPHNGAPRQSHPVIQALQAGNPKPAAGAVLNLGGGYAGEALTLAREYSVAMTMDALFEQWDRYSGGNTALRKSDDGKAHFYLSDNGGADPSNSGDWTRRNLDWFSRYDRQTIAQLAELGAFLTGATGNFLGYDNRLDFLADLGLYYELTPQTYLKRFSRNLGLLADRVAAISATFGDQAFFD